MKKSVLAVFMVMMFVLSCGKKGVVISSPADGYAFAATPGACFQVALEEQDNEATVEIRGVTSELARDLSCTNGGGGVVAQCCGIYNPNGFNAGGYNTQTTFTLVIIAAKGDFKDVRTVVVTKQPLSGYGTPVPTP